jgi:hypothetical protein
LSRIGQTDFVSKGDSFFVMHRGFQTIQVQGWLALSFAVIGLLAVSLA